MRIEILRATSVAAAGLLGATGVVMGAVSAHLGPALLDAHRQSILHQGVEMQMWHALALLGAGAALRTSDWIARLAVTGLLLGTLLFCGAVYALVFGLATTGTVAPAGGFVLIASWLLLGVAGVRAVRQAPTALT